MGIEKFLSLLEVKKRSRLKSIHTFFDGFLYSQKLKLRF